MFCQKCGNQIPDDSTFCGKCGTKIEALQQDKQHIQHEPQNKPQQSLSNDAIGAERSKKVFICSGAVAIVLGIIAAVSNVMFIGMLCAIAACVTVFAFVAFMRYTQDIPDDEKTEGQKNFIKVMRIIIIIAILFFIWYRFLGGMDVIINSMLN